jgi:3-phenylpropionate/trans-cinnamate dioxygenase ferredoxin subunit
MTAAAPAVATAPPGRPRTRHVVARAGELAPGQRKLVRLGRVSAGLFNVAGAYHCLANVCPHQGAPLCVGPLTGTNLPSAPYTYVWGRDQLVLRCPWHGWEFDLETGCALFDPRVRTRRYEVAVEGGQVVVYA